MKPFTLYCPTCDEPFYCNVDLPDRSVGIMGVTIVEVWAASEDPRDSVCGHVQMWFDYTTCTVDILDEEDERAQKRLAQFGDKLYDQLDRLRPHEFKL